MSAKGSHFDLSRACFGPIREWALLRAFLAFLFSSTTGHVAFASEAIATKRGTLEAIDLPAYVVSIAATEDSRRSCFPCGSDPLLFVVRFEQAHPKHREETLIHRRLVDLLLFGPFSILVSPSDVAAKSASASTSASASASAHSCCV